MPIDLVTFRNADQAVVLEQSQKARFDKRTVNLAKLIDPESTTEEQVPIIDAINQLDVKWRDSQYAKENGARQMNEIGKRIKEKSKAKQPIDGEKQESLILKAAIAEHTRLSTLYAELRDKLINSIGNIVHPSVPQYQDEAYNTIERVWGVPSMKKNNLHHHHLLHMIGGYASEQGVNVAGHRGYFLTEAGLLLNQALIRYGISFLRKNQYTAMQPPYFMKQDVMAKTAQLEDFDEALYKVSGEGNQEFYLIATSEQPISAFHLGEWMEKSALPKRYCGLSSCFRKEAGAHGKDAWGIFRVHQFEKIEQFVLCAPEESWEMLDQMVGTSEKFLQSLGLPYRVVTIVSGALNNAAAKKFDIEAWFPTLGVYRELVSCSNCTDYQSRAMETRYGTSGKNADGKQYVHMLNGTLCATTRTLCCILENYQTEKGVVVPRALRRFMDWTEEAAENLDNDELWTLPYVNEKPAHEAGTVAKKGKKQ